MTWPQAVITFFCVWWLVWMAVLPFGVKRVENPPPLHDPGAPEHPHFLPKFIITTLLAVALTFAMMKLLEAGWIRLETNDPKF